MLTFTLSRQEDGLNSSAGKLFDPNGEPICATLERSWINNRPNVSRIPAGTYVLKLKPLGSSHFDSFYSKLFPDMHKGMIEVTGVEGRDQILIHQANWYYQLEGCIATGQHTRANGKNFEIPPGESRPAYVAAYKLISAAIEMEGAELRVNDPVAAPLIA